jgi:hypothetical protein
MNILEVLMEIDRALVEWIVHATPNESAEAVALPELVALRDRLNEIIRWAAVQEALHASPVDVSMQLAQLASIQEALVNTPRTIEAVNQVLAYTSNVISIARSVLAMNGGSGPSVLAPPQLTLGNEGDAAHGGTLLPIAATEEPLFERIETVQDDNRISTGFSRMDSPTVALSPHHPLEAAKELYFWFEVGLPVHGGIEVSPIYAPDLGSGAEIVVALFGQPNAILVSRGEGRLRLERGAGRVVQQPEELAWTDAVQKRRLFFRLVTPEAPGQYAFRCNLYHEGLLVQSLRVTARVGDAGGVGRPLRTELDYVLSHSLHSEQLSKLGPHRLSVLGNQEDGTHGFRFYGAGEVRGSAYLDTAEVQDFLNQARKAYRNLSWGSPTAFDPEHPPAYRYNGAEGFDQLARDLVALAKVGFGIWASVAGRLALDEDGSPFAREKLQAHMRPPGGRVQLALKRSSRHALPVALFYDHPLDDQLPTESLRLCPAFTAAPHADPLQTPCFQGDAGCPRCDDMTVVCPSGFWGFRHTIGIPVTMAAKGGDAPVHLAHGPPRFAALVWAESDFTKRDDHLRTLSALYGNGYDEARTREKALRLLKSDEANVLYFYCHGGVDNNGNPLLRVGNLQDPAIAVSNFAGYQILWKRNHPLVFINGCHTVDVEPARALHFVDELVRNVGAAGVIGTEVTIFEGLAVSFASRFFEHLRDADLGEAMRRARLELLGQQRNPLGLLYVAYAMSSLRMSDSVAS